MRSKIMDIFKRILLLLLGLQTVSCKLNYVENSTSWQNAITHCRSLGNEVSCIPYEAEISETSRIWINLFTTFSSWFQFIACIQSSKIEYFADKTYSVEDGNSGTCQLECYGFDYFITKQETCFCFHEFSISRSESTNCQSENVYKVFKKDMKTNFPLDPTTSCEYLYCNQNVPETGLPIQNLTTSCNYTKDQPIAICEYPGATHQCLSYTGFQRHYKDDDIEPGDITCAAYKVECKKRGSKNCEKIVVPEAGGTYKRQVGITSTLVHYNKDTPVIACGYIYKSTNSDYEIGFFGGEKCKQQNMSFFCESDFKDPSCYNNVSTNIFPKRLFISRIVTEKSIPTTVAVEKLRTSEKTITTGATVGIIIGLCLISAIVIAVIIIMTKRLRRSKNEKNGNKQNGVESTQVTPVTNTAFGSGRSSISNASEYDYIQEPQCYKTNGGYEELDIGDNKDCEYTDNSEYDHLHRKGERKINTSLEDNLYSHGSDSTYDTGNTLSNCIDRSTYNTASSNDVTDEDYNRLDIRKV